MKREKPVAYKKAADAIKHGRLIHVDKSLTSNGEGFLAQGSWHYLVDSVGDVWVVACTEEKLWLDRAVVNEV